MSHRPYGQLRFSLVAAKACLPKIGEASVAFVGNEDVVLS